MKKLIGTVIGMSAFLMMATPSFAASCANGTTGALSRNWCVQLDAKVAAFRLNNTGAVTQNTNTTSLTGGNSTFGNTSVTNGVTAGAATADTTKDAALNGNQLTLTQSSATDVPVLSNNTTGYNSTNVAIGANVRAVVFRVDNVGYITQNTNTTSNSGGNSVQYNTVGGSVTTGNASASTNVTSSLNTNIINITQ